VFSLDHEAASLTSILPHIKGFFDLVRLARLIKWLALASCTLSYSNTGLYN
jgi:hypothetical protein